MFFLSNFCQAQGNVSPELNSNAPRKPLKDAPGSQIHPAQNNSSMLGTTSCSDRGIKDTHIQIKFVIQNPKMTENKPVNLLKQIKIRLLITPYSRQQNYETVNRKQKPRGWRDISVSFYTHKKKWKSGTEKEAEKHLRCKIVCQKFGDTTEDKTLPIPSTRKVVFSVTLVLLTNLPQQINSTALAAASAAFRNQLVGCNELFRWKGPKRIPELTGQARALYKWEMS